MTSGEQNSYSCIECGSTFSSLQALGGHKSAHSAKRRRADSVAQRHSYESTSSRAPLRTFGSVVPRNPNDIIARFGWPDAGFQLAYQDYLLSKYLQSYRRSTTFDEDQNSRRYLPSYLGSLDQVASEEAMLAASAQLESAAKKLRANKSDPLEPCKEAAVFTDTKTHSSLPQNKPSQFPPMLCSLFSLDSSGTKSLHLLLICVKTMLPTRAISTTILVMTNQLSLPHIITRQSQWARMRHSCLTSQASGVPSCTPDSTRWRQPVLCIVPMTCVLLSQHSLELRLALKRKCNHPRAERALCIVIRFNTQMLHVKLLLQASSDRACHQVPV